MPPVMPEKIVIKKDMACPVIICDHCGKEITDAKDGNCIWQEVSTPKGRAIDGRHYYTHKKCNRMFMQQNGDPARWCSNDLDTHLIYLLNNLKWNPKDASRKALFLDQVR